MQLHQGHHADDDALEKYALGSLRDPTLEQIEQHLLICSECQSRLAEMDEFVSAMRSAASQLDAGDESRRGFWSRLPVFFPFRKAAWTLALAAAVLIGAAAWLTMTREPSAPAVAMLLESTRAAETRHAPAGRRLALDLDVNGLPAFSEYRVEMVDERGHPITAVRVPSTRVALESKGLRRGVYFIRVYSPAQELLREYGLQVD